MDQMRRIKNFWALVEVGNWGGTEKMKLFKSSFVPDQNTTLADFAANEVSFTGYTPFVLAGAWATGLSVGGDEQFIYSGVAEFDQTNTLLTDIAGGFWIEDGAGTQLFLADLFDVPVAFDRTGNKLFIKPSYTHDMDAEADVELIIGP